MDSTKLILTLFFFLSLDFNQHNIFCRIFTNILIFFVRFTTTPLRGSFGAEWPYISNFYALIAVAIVSMFKQKYIYVENSISETEDVKGGEKNIKEVEQNSETKRVGVLQYATV